jgi:hypothetical protein
MRIVAIVVGVDNWHEFTERFVHQLHNNNPELEILLIDNGSHPKYPKGEGYEIFRIDETVGYNHALNVGLIQTGKADWYICFNNDCECTGSFVNKVAELDRDVLYGSGENRDNENGITFQWSAWLIISSKIYSKVGLFDPELIGAYEDFDYELRAIGSGFKLETCKLPVVHLDKHSRMETPSYNWRWRESRKYFADKWKLGTREWLKD